MSLPAVNHRYPTNLVTSLHTTSKRKMAVFQEKIENLAKTTLENLISVKAKVSIFLNKPIVKISLCLVAGAIALSLGVLCLSLGPVVWGVGLVAIGIICGITAASAYGLHLAIKPWSLK